MSQTAASKGRTGWASPRARPSKIEKPGLDLPGSGRRFMAKGLTCLAIEIIGSVGKDIFWPKIAPRCPPQITPDGGAPKYHRINCQRDRHHPTPPRVREGRGRC